MSCFVIIFTQNVFYRFSVLSVLSYDLLLCLMPVVAKILTVTGAQTYGHPATEVCFRIVSYSGIPKMQMLLIRLRI